MDWLTDAWIEVRDSLYSFVNVPQEQALKTIMREGLD